MEEMKKISVSRLLNLYFPGIDLFSYPVQKGIFRGICVDYALEDYYKTKKLELRSKKDILKRINNEQVSKEVDSIYDESQKCLDGVHKFLNDYNINIHDVQVHPENIAFPVHGYIDALVLIDGQEYVVDWKAKGEFKEYNYKNIDEKNYDNHVKWFNDHNLTPKKINDWIISEKKRNKKYSLGHLRYCLQVCLYWMILGKPKNVKPAVIYFDNTSNYYIYTFDCKKAQKICETLIKYKDTNDAKREFVSIKLANEDWIKYINWKRINN